MLGLLGTPSPVVSKIVQLDFWLPEAEKLRFLFKPFPPQLVPTSCKLPPADTYAVTSLLEMMQHIKETLQA